MAAGNDFSGDDGDLLSDELQEWTGLRYRVRLSRSARLPPNRLITAAFGLVFVDDRMLFTRLASRGWDLPGGHLEPGESAEAAMRREVFEETAVELGVAVPFAYQHIQLLSKPPPDYSYPVPDGYQVYFVATHAEVGVLVPSDEALEAQFFAPHEGVQLDCVRRTRSLYDAALAWALNV